MPVVPTVLYDHIAVRAVFMVDRECLAAEALDQFLLDLHSHIPGRAGFLAADGDFGLVGLYPELGDQFIVPGPVSWDIDIDIFAVPEEKNAACGKGGQEQKQQQEAQEREKLTGLLQTADFVKFAKATPLPNENAHNLDIAYEFVNHTNQKIKQEQQKLEAQMMKAEEEETEKLADAE